MRFYLCLLSLTVLLVGCGVQAAFFAPIEPEAAVYTTSASPATTLTVFAAASLTESFTAIADAFEADRPDVDVLVNFAGSQSLRLQIEQGARADVFASANQQYAEALLAADLIKMPVIFAHNRLVVIVPAANPASIETLADLTRPDLKLVLAGPEVPVGRYTRQALAKLNHNPSLGPDFSGQVLANLVSEEENVKAVVAKVQLGEADAGIVYASDVTPAVANDLKTVAIPPAFNIVADYLLAVVSDSTEPDLAQQFIDFVRSPRGQAILAEHGFQPVQPQP